MQQAHQSAIAVSLATPSPAGMAILRQVAGSQGEASLPSNKRMLDKLRSAWAAASEGRARTPREPHRGPGVRQCPEGTVLSPDNFPIAFAGQAQAALLPAHPTAGEWAGSEPLQQLARKAQSVLGHLSSRRSQLTAWILEALDVIAGTSGHPIGSCSFDDHPGLVAVSIEADPPMLAEMLVHECSHQYFLVAQKLLELTYDPSTLVRSPLAESERPAIRALMAYHALCEMLRTRLLWDGPIPDPQAHRFRTEQLGKLAEEARSALQGSDVLTPMGLLFIDSCLAMEGQHAIHGH